MSHEPSMSTHERSILERVNETVVKDQFSFTTMVGLEKKKGVDRTPGMTRLAFRIVSILIVFVAFSCSDTGVSVLASFLFAMDGIYHITWPTLWYTLLSDGTESLTGKIDSGEASVSAGRCYSDRHPLVNWAIRRAEERLASTGKVVKTKPVREIQFYDMEQTCQEALWEHPMDKHHPFIIRNFAGKRAYEELSSAWLLAHFGGMNVTVMDMKAYGKRASEIAACPHVRKDLYQTVTMKEMNENDHLYAQFNRKNYIAVTRGMEMTGAPLTKILTQLKNMCGLFNSRFTYEGELFFGWNNPDDPLTKLGTPFHNALFGNLFLQVHGERKWRLVDPAYTKYMRPMHGYAYNTGCGYHEKGWHNLTDPKHWDAIPKLSVTTRPGDVLYVPPWWWHEIRVDKPGFTLGMSNRELLRPWAVNGAPVSLDRSLLYLVHGFSGLVMQWLRKTRFFPRKKLRNIRPDVEQLQHSKAFP